eukprot:tig00021758_g23396.t1
MRLRPRCYGRWLKLLLAAPLIILALSSFRLGAIALAASRVFGTDDIDHGDRTPRKLLQSSSRAQLALPNSKSSSVSSNETHSKFLPIPRYDFLYSLALGSGRASDEQLEAMREFRRVIYRNQYRSREDCSPRVSQFLLFRFGAAGARAGSRTPRGRDPGRGPGAGAGFGSELHHMAYALGLALKTRRVLLVAPHQDWLYADHDLCAEECRSLDCHMLPLSTCSRAGGGAQANKTVLYYDFAAWSDAALARSVASPGEARPPGFEKWGPEWAHAQARPRPRAGRAPARAPPHVPARQVVAFLLRFNARSAAWLEEGLRAAGLAPGAPCVSIHVRRQDKKSEARPLPLARVPRPLRPRGRGRPAGRPGQYVERAGPFLRALDTTLLFVATDEAAVLREEAGRTSRATPSSTPREGPRGGRGPAGRGEPRLRPGRRGQVFDHAGHLRERRRGGTRTREWKAAMVDVVALATCGASVVTFSSNIGRLVAEVATFLRHNHTRARAAPAPAPASRGRSQGAGRQVRGEVVSLDDTFYLWP